jgi:hypothetical protein
LVGEVLTRDDFIKLHFGQKLLDKFSSSDTTGVNLPDYYGK